MTARSIATPDARKKLALRREPYWHALGTNRAVGYRRMSEKTAGTWFARYTPPGAKPIPKQLPEVLDLPDAQRFTAACEAAQKWFTHLGAGGPVEAITVRKACENYLDHLRETKGEKSAEIEARRFQRLVYDRPAFADTEVAGLTSADFTAWRKRVTTRQTQARHTRGKALSASTSARDLTPFRAALNRAYETGQVLSNQAWLLPLAAPKVATTRRELYFSPEERRALLSKFEQPDQIAFFSALSQLPLRPGALAQIKVGDFDKRSSVIHIREDKKHGARMIRLPAAAAALFAEQTTDKLPGAYLFSRTDGRPWKAETWRGPMKIAAVAAGLSQKSSAYALRHSTISDLVSAGVDLASVAVLAGTSIAMIQKHYYHLQPGVSVAALEVLDLSRRAHAQ